MKKLFCLLFLFLNTVCFSQSLTKSSRECMFQLPRTSDDFQNYQYNYPLENGMDVKSSYYMVSDFSAFDDVGIFPFEVQDLTKVKSILFTVYNSNGDIAVYGKASYNHKGQVSNYDGKNNISENYVYGFDKWSEIKGVPRDLTSCIPNPYTYKTKATRNSKGLITNVEKELSYYYDSQDRVIKVVLNNNPFYYQYEYIENTKNISKIYVYEYGRLRGEVTYGYNNGIIVTVDCIIYHSTTSVEGIIEEEGHKKYQYDSHNNISDIIFVKGKITDASRYVHYTFNNSYDSEGKIIESHISKIDNFYAGKYTYGSKTPEKFIRKYTYDKQGNWIKIEDGMGCVRREIVYWPKTNIGEDIIYDEEDVTVNATFGQTFDDYFKSHVLYPVVLEESGYIINTSINASFTIEKDGSISNLDIQNDSKERERFIGNTKYQIEKLSWIPATINGKPVRCNVDVGFRFNNCDVIVTKDIKFTRAEYDAYKNAGAFLAKKQELSMVRKLEEEAKDGKISSIMKLGRMYLQGDKVEKDSVKAIELFLDIAVRKFRANMEIENEAKSLLIQNKEVLLKNQGFVKRVANSEFKKNLTIPDPWTEMCIEASAKLGNKTILYDQIEKSKANDPEGVFKWQEMVAKYYNDNDIMYSVALIYLDSSSKYFNISRGVEFLTKAADSGNVKARKKLGNMYKKGKYVIKDMQKAKYYLEMK